MAWSRWESTLEIPFFYFIKKKKKKKQQQQQQQQQQQCCERSVLYDVQDNYYIVSQGIWCVVVVIVWDP